MRDKLKSLIDTFFCSVDIDKFYSQNQKEKLANWLRENGVIVPPCKVGDTVYMITPNGNIRNLTILSIDIELEKEKVKMTCLAVYEFEDKPCYMQIHSFKFGKTVFLTREEAENALAERQEENG